MSPDLRHTTVSVPDLVLDAYTRHSSCTDVKTSGGPTVGLRLVADHELFAEMSLPYFAALIFDPDRFLDDRLRRYLLPNPFIFLPFNAGPRMCLGQQVNLFQSWPVALKHWC